MSSYCCSNSGQILQHLDCGNIVMTIFPFIFSWYEVKIAISLRNWMFFFYPTCNTNRVLAELHCSSCKLCLKARAALLIGLGWRPCMKKKKELETILDMLCQIFCYRFYHTNSAINIVLVGTTHSNQGNCFMNTK